MLGIVQSECSCSKMGSFSGQPATASQQTPKRRSPSSEGLAETASEFHSEAAKPVPYEPQDDASCAASDTPFLRSVVHDA
jgi:hypothetical protein